MYKLSNKTLFTAVIFIALSFIITGCGGDSNNTVPLSTPTPVGYSGNIIADTLWSGEVTVYNSMTVTRGNTLTIAPGTKIKFKHYRGYKEPEEKILLTVRGTLIAEGTANNPIYFTSDAPDPRNGDWSMVKLLSPESTCKFSYCVFECAQQGLNVYSGNALISNCIFRWNNWEGLYFESSCQSSITDSKFYENGYNGLAAEQYNSIAMDYCEVWRNGTNGVHVDITELEILRSLIYENQANGLSVDNNGDLLAMGVNIHDNQDWGIGYGNGINNVEISNLTFNNNGLGEIEGFYSTANSTYYPPAQIDSGFTPDMSYAPGYIPGDQSLDPYLYIYPDDETRRIERKIGAGLGLTWSLAWDGNHIWTATLGGKIYKLNPVTGEILKEFSSPGPQPWGMTYDGEYLWVVDFALQTISKVSPDTGEALETYSTPSACKGVTWDGINLNLMGWSSSKIYRIDRKGQQIETINLPLGGGGIAWDGSSFWVPGGGRILKYSPEGTLEGWIYAASDGTWDLTWNGNYLWAAQRTNENWQDAKIYALELLDIQNP